MLTLPALWDAGVALLGGTVTRNLIFRNTGGAGRFIILPAAAWPDEANAPAFDTSSSALVGPFSIYPNWLELQPGEQANLTVTFSSVEPGVHQEQVVLICDNCHVKEFTLKVGIGMCNAGHTQMSC